MLRVIFVAHHDLYNAGEGARFPPSQAAALVARGVAKWHPDDAPSDGRAEQEAGAARQQEEEAAAVKLREEGEQRAAEAARQAQEQADADAVRRQQEDEQHAAEADRPHEDDVPHDLAS